MDKDQQREESDFWCETVSIEGEDPERTPINWFQSERKQPRSFLSLFVSFVLWDFMVTYILQAILQLHRCALHFTRSRQFSPNIYFPKTTWRLIQSARGNIRHRTFIIGKVSGPGSCEHLVQPNGRPGQLQNTHFQLLTALKMYYEHTHNYSQGFIHILRLFFIK
jgi:hypothetical protein